MRRASSATPALPVPTRLLITLLVASALVLPACVTERTTRPTYGVQGGRATSSRATASRTPGSAGDAPVTLPDGPLAHPVASDTTTSSRIRASLMDLGTVPYDAQVLPLVSPDGRFVAVEDGVAPTWPTILAAPGAEVPHSTRVRAFALPDPHAADPSGQPPAAQPITWNESYDGILLGRSCDTSGFLVEAPQPDGSRWIGHVSWVSGSLRWLVQGTAVNAYAVFGPGGEFAYCRRNIESNAVELVVRPGATDTREYVASPAGGGYLWPVCTDEPGVVYAFSLVAGNVELHTLKIPQKGDPPTLVIVSRQPLLKSADAASLYQMTASTQVPLPRTLTSLPQAQADRQEDGGFNKLIFFHAGLGRMCVFDRRVAALVPLFPGSFAASPVLASPNEPASPRSGYLITSQRGLEYVPWSQKSEFEQLRGVPASGEEGVAVIKGAYIPRLTSDPTWPVVLLGPAPGAGGARIHLFRLKMEGAEAGGVGGR